MSQAATAYIDDMKTTPEPMDPVACGACGHTVFDGIVIKSRVVRLLPRGGAEAKCRCKRWVAVPATYDPSRL